MKFQVLARSAKTLFSPVSEVGSGGFDPDKREYDGNILVTWSEIFKFPGK